MRQALVVAAGRGARLDRPGTPKPLVDVGGQPIIIRLIKQMCKAGIEEVHVVVGYQGDKIRRAIASHPWQSGKVVVHENVKWNSGMGFSVLLVKDQLREPFMLAIGDHVFDERLVDMMAGLSPEPGEVCALVDRNAGNGPQVDSALKVKLGDERVAAVGWDLEHFDAVDAGLFAATDELFSSMAAVVATVEQPDLSDGLAALADAGKLTFKETQGLHWDDVDTPADLVRAEAYLRDRMRADRGSRRDPGDSRSSGSVVFDYVLGAPQTVSMVVQRGVVADPLSAEIIPSKNATSPIFVFTDETVGELYGQGFCGRLRSAGYKVNQITLPDGEEAKTLSNYVYLVERVLSRGVDERSVFISLGGGVPCNVCGFIASSIYRGLDLVHVPTTLMAQCDAAISHKQAINGQRGKNMVGSYYNPRSVIVDVDALSTLDDRQIRDGMAEVIKHALGQDPLLARYLIEYQGELRNPEFLETVIKKNIELKCALVRNDPRELAEGMVLQYGHTVGHPVEHLSGYTLYHGESVAIGMMVAARVARILGACDDGLVSVHAELLSKYHLPIRSPAYIRTEDMHDGLKFNKRYLSEGTRMALLEEVGKLWSVDGEYAIPVSPLVLTEAFDQTREAR